MQAPSRSPCQREVIIGPATSPIAGRLAEIAPISCAGTVLSQPPTSTTASIGWARIISSVSIAIRLRNIRLVGTEKDFAQRDRREHQRQPAGGEHAALHRLDQLGEMAVAIVEAGRRVGDADHRLRQHVERIAHRAGERAAQIKREIGVAVIGQAQAQAMRAGRPDRSSSISSRNRNVTVACPLHCQSRKSIVTTIATYPSAAAETLILCSLPSEDFGNTIRAKKIRPYVSTLALILTELATTLSTWEFPQLFGVDRDYRNRPAAPRGARARQIEGGMPWQNPREGGRPERSMTSSAGASANGVSCSV